MAAPNVLLMYAPSEPHLRALKAAAPRAQLHVATSEESARELIVGADAVLGNRYFLQSLDAARRLRWMQSNSMGVDLLVAGASERSFTLTCARGVYDDEVADHALALVLALARGIPDACQAQRACCWRRAPLRRMSDLRTLLLGFGGIGRAITRRLRGFDMEVTAVRRGACASEESIAVLNDPDAWRGRLPQTDLVILALPKTPQTIGLIGARELAALPPGALLVNVGRGGTVDEHALLAALHYGHLGGAALDVFEREPLSDDNPLWNAPRLLVSAHLGRSPEQPPYRFEALFVENLRRFAAGEPLLHVVDREAGY